MLCPIRIYPLEVEHNLGTWRNQCLLKKKKGNALFPKLGHFFTTASTRVSQKDCSLILAQHAANGGWYGYQIFAVQEQGSLWISLASESFYLQLPQKSPGTTSLWTLCLESLHYQHPRSCCSECPPARLWPCLHCFTDLVISEEMEINHFFMHGG